VETKAGTALIVWGMSVISSKHMDAAHTPVEIYPLILVLTRRVCICPAFRKPYGRHDRGGSQTIAESGIGRFSIMHLVRTAKFAKADRLMQSL